MLKQIKEKFQSGNAIPVTRAALTDKEFNFLLGKLEAYEEAMQEFVDRVDRGEVRSKRTYAKFKELLTK